MCFAALLCEQFLPIREWRRQDIDQVLLHGDHFFLSAFSSSEVPGKHASMSKLPTAACWSREKREEGVKPTCFLSKATSVPQANNSQYSSPVEALNLIVESKSLPVEVNNSTIELHLSVEAKEKLAIIDSKCGSLVEANHSTKCRSLIEANHSTVNSDDCLGFETKSELISSVESIHSTVESNCFSTLQSKENFSSTTLSCRLLNDVEHSSKCVGIAERRFASFEEQKLDCDIYSIKYGERRQGFINANVTRYSCLSLCSALMNTFTTYKQAIVIFRNVSLTILSESNGSFYTFDPHARNGDNW